MSYVIYFDIEGKQYPLPVNPEEIEISQDQDIEEYDILKQGKIGIPGNLGLREISFEAEFPSQPHPYVNTLKDFKPAWFYLELFKKARLSNKPIRFVASSDYHSISELVTIEETKEVEKGGEEGDIYISFSLRQYVPYHMKTMDPKSSNPLTTPTTKRVGNPPQPNNQTYVVQKGDNLWTIAKRFLGDGNKYRDIHQANKTVIGNNPNLIKAGMKLTLPGR